MKQFTLSDVDPLLYAMPDDTDAIEGNVSAYDEETDAAAEESIYEGLSNGNEWAWFSAQVFVVPNFVWEYETTLPDDIINNARNGFDAEEKLEAESIPFGVSTEIGGFSYESKKAFMESDDYKNLVEEALKDLNDWFSKPENIEKLHATFDGVDEHIGAKSVKIVRKSTGTSVSSKSAGAALAAWNKLLPRIEQGANNPDPDMLIGSVNASEDWMSWIAGVSKEFENDTSDKAGRFQQADEDLDNFLGEWWESHQSFEEWAEENDDTYIGNWVEDNAADIQKFIKQVVPLMQAVMDAIA